MVEFSQQLWETGIQKQNFSLYEQVKVLALDRKLNKLFPQYEMIDGVANVWVVKPSFNARGVGVYCTNRLKDIIQQGKKNGSKVVQKYIERPFLLKGKKFDIRQWVLVTSWEPLDVYVFSGAYLKICGNDFNLRNLSDQFSHLSNFTIQKTNKQSSNDDLVMSHTQFEAFVRSSTGLQDWGWDTHMRPQIHKVVFATLKAVQEAMEQRPLTFEIYGFDLVLDEDLRPWVIEVNLSPACAERTDWLIKMVDDMSLDLVSYLEQRIIQQNESDPDPEGVNKDRPKRIAQLPPPYSLTLNKDSFYEDNDIKHKWMRLEESILETKNFKITEQSFLVLQAMKVNQQFEISGVKVNTKAEKNIDKDFKKLNSAILIQSYFRGFLARKAYTLMQQEKASILIQRHLRQKLALNTVHHIIQNNSAIVIQKYLFKKLAINRVKLMIQQKIAKAKLYVALRCQAHFRRKKAQQLLIIFRKHQCATKIQSYLRRIRAIKIRNEKFDFKTKLILIQRFIKKRMRQKRSQAIYIQKTLRRVRAVKKVKKLLQIYKASVILTAIITKMKKRRYFKNLRNHSRAIYIQCALRKAIAVKKVRTLKQNRAQQKLQSLFRKIIIRKLLQTSQQFFTEINKKTVLIQANLRAFLARKTVQKQILQRRKHQSVILIQKYLRSFLAQREVVQRRIFFCSLIKIQSFIRMIIAKRTLRKLKKKRDRKEGLKQRHLEKKFSRKNSARKHNKEMECYIENLLNKELLSSQHNESANSNRNLNQGLLGSSHTPAHILTRKSYNELPHYSQTNLRSSECNLTKCLESQAYLMQQHNQSFAYKRESHQESGDQLEPLFYQPQDLAVGELPLIRTKQGSMYEQQTDESSKNTQKDCGAETNFADRLQKSLRIRKHPKTNVSMMNTCTSKGVKSASYQRGLTDKVMQAINKTKTSASNQMTSSSQRQEVLANSAHKNKHPKAKIHELPKPKTFAENLMNMLAKQTIGQVFSENPVEALSILKEKPPITKAGKSQQQVDNSQRRISNQNETVKVDQTTLQDTSSQQATSIEIQSTRFTTFPKLSDFKSATNNIYLQNRPVVDPRAEAEYQQALIEQRAKLQSKQSMANNGSRIDIHNRPHGSANNVIDSSMLRQSIEYSRQQQPLDRYGNPLQSVSPSMPTGLTALEDNMLLQRPKDTNMMVVQAYKKQLAYNQKLEQFAQSESIQIAQPSAQRNSLGHTKSKTKKHQIDACAKSKNKFLKMVEMDDGIMLPHTSQGQTLTQFQQDLLNAQQQQQQPRAKRSQNQVIQSSMNSNNSNVQSTEPTRGSGGATTMPPIFMETKLMIV